MLLKKYLRLSFVGIKAQHKTALIPLIVVYLLVPALNLAVWKRYGIEYTLYINIIQFTQMLFPFFSVWWSFFTLREYTEGAGSELLYVCDKNGQSIMAVITWMIYIVMLIPLYIVYTACFTTMIFEFVRIVCESLLMLGILYLCVNLLHSTALSLIPIFAYLIVNVSSKNESVFLFYSLDEISQPQLLGKYIIMAFIGIAMIILGEILNKKCKVIN